MKSQVQWAYIKGKWATKLFGVLYWVKAYKKDLWHISNTLVNDIRNRDIYPNEYRKWTYCQNLKKTWSELNPEDARYLESSSRRDCFPRIDY